MKKVLLFLLVFCFFYFGIVTFCDEELPNVIIIAGESIDLNEDGYEMNYNGVNFQKKGEYSAEYTKNGNDAIRIVDVIDEDDEYFDLLRRQEEKEINSSLVSDIRKIEIGENNYFLFLSLEKITGFKMFYIYYYKNGYENWNLEYLQYELFDYILMENNHILLLLKPLNAIQDIKFLEIDTNGKISENDLDLSDVYSFKYNKEFNALYFISVSSGVLSFLEMKYSNLKIVRTVKIKDSEKYNDYSFLGYTYNDSNCTILINKEDSFIYLYFDKYLNLVNEKEIIIKGEGKIIINGNNILKIAYKNDVTLFEENSEIEYSFYNYDEDILYKNKVCFDCCIDDIEYSNLGELIALKIDFEDKKDKYFLYNNNLSRSLIDDKYKFNQNCYWYIENKKTKYGELSVINILKCNKNIKINEVSVNDEEYLVFFNGEKQKSLNEFEYVTNKFGKYNYSSKYVIDSFFDIYLKSNYYVDDMINLVDNAIYDLGVVILFNGEGSLNNESIESGTKINEVGFYNLKVVGNNDSMSLNFEVKDLSVKEEIKQIESNASSVNKINLDDNVKIIKSENVPLANEYNYEFSEQIKVKPMIYIIVVTIISILLSIIICFKKPSKKEKNI